MTACGFFGCTYPATHGIKLCVPCIGQALAQHRPLELMLGLQLCEGHAKAADVANFFVDRPIGMGLRNPPPSTSPFKPIFDHAAGAQGEKPDYDRAFIAPVPLGSAEWKEFLARSQTANPQGNA